MCSDKLQLLANRLRNLCTNFDDFLSIRQKIHELNQPIYDALKQTTEKKFKELVSAKYGNDNKIRSQTLLYYTHINTINKHFSKQENDDRGPLQSTEPEPKKADN